MLDLVKILLMRVIDSSVIENMLIDKSKNLAGNNSESLVFPLNPEPFSCLLCKSPLLCTYKIVVILGSIYY